MIHLFIIEKHPNSNVGMLNYDFPLEELYSLCDWTPALDSHVQLESCSTVQSRGNAQLWVLGLKVAGHVNEMCSG